ncbi:MAG: SDR family NAD(P)-dependent oxidoreductase [Gammaproteobacteria bacterium]
MNPPPDSSLSGRVAIVTGASRGIGKQACLALARRGASVVIAARTVQARERTPGTLGDTADELRALGAEPLIVQADMGRQEDLDRVVATAIAHHGHVDILVNNAAYTVGKALWAHVPEIGRAQWEQMLAINVTAPLMLAQACWPSMRARGGGVIVNVTSGAAQPQPLALGTGLPGTGDETGPLYGTTKAALDRMANAMAHEGAKHRIAVINLNPGFVLTETMEQTFKAQAVDAAATGAISPAVPAAVIAWLCANEDPMRFSGTIVDAPRVAAALGLP